MTKMDGQKFAVIFFLLCWCMW